MSATLSDSNQRVFVKLIHTLLVLLITALAAPESLSKKGRGLGHLPAPNHQFPSPGEAKVDLGRNLMFDKILSGNRNISCGTCHHSLAATGDGLSLPVGEGGSGLGVTRTSGTGADLIVERVPRNAPPVFNLGDAFFHTLFHDGRVTRVEGSGYPSNCITPAGMMLPDTLENVLACQAMFPVTSATEMAGQINENEIANATAVPNNFPVIWDLLAQRLQAIPEYVEMFKAAFDDVNVAQDITYAHAANAIAAFEGSRWRCDDSPFDRFLRGNSQAMSKVAVDGMKLFYGDDGNGNSCADCHSGLYQTDQAFHAIAMPQIGAGRGSNSEGQSDGREDFGREQVTGQEADILKFRTPSLRNIALTAPYGHSGPYNSLRAVVEHHLDPVAYLYAYNQNRQAILPTHPTLDSDNYAAMDVPDIVDFIAQRNVLPAMSYSDEEVDKIIEFLHALTDPSCLDLRSDFDVVKGVPSGLPIFD